MSHTHSDQSHTIQVEIERKYAVDAEPLPDLVGVGAAGVRISAAEAQEPFVLEAVYYDTADLALARARIALRRRTGGHDEGWHVKLPAIEGRTELQWPLDDAATEDGASGDGVPEAVRAAVIVYVRDRALSPLASVRTRRSVTELRDAENRVVVEIADDSVSGTDAREGGVRLWREWEAELGPGAPTTAEGRAALLDEVEQRLLRAGASVSPSVSKLAQALGRTGLGPVPDASSLGGEAPSAASGDASAVLLAGLRELTGQLVTLDPAVRADSADAVHRQRTVVRRLRNVLAGHRRLFAPVPLQEVREALARYGGILGDVRDLEVRADWAEAELDAVRNERGVDDPAARERLVSSPRSEHDAAHARLIDWMSSAPYFRLLDALEALLPADGVDGSARHESKTVLRRAAKKADRRSVRRGRAARVFDADPVLAARAVAALHDSRKSARRLRHLAEFAVEAPDAPLGTAAGRIGDAAEHLQDSLGEHRDALLFAEYVLLMAPRADAAGESSFVYGVLYQRSLDRARAALAAAADARKALRAAV